MPANCFVQLRGPCSTGVTTTGSSVGSDGGRVDGVAGGGGRRRFRSRFSSAFDARLRFWYSRTPSGWRAYWMAPRPNSTNTHFGEMGRKPGDAVGARGGSSRRTAPLRMMASNSENDAAAMAAPSTVREPRVTTSTTQNSATNGEKLVP